MSVAVAFSDPPRLDAMTADDHEVLTRLIQYALGEADRKGEIACAAHLAQALAALSEKQDIDRADLSQSNTMRRRVLS
ncbi:MAG: hypothetical protein AAGJ94_05230 [Pseudomonadota bacterium]